MQDENAITVWAWEDAPADLQALSEHGGDEDWVALVPLKYSEAWRLGWLERIDSSHSPQVVAHPSISNFEVWIGAHA